MKPNLRTIASTTIAILFLAPLILSITPIQAQLTVARIVSVPSVAYPGEPVAITIDVAMSTTVYVKLCNATDCPKPWASTMFVPPTPGQYTVSLTLPLSLPGATDSYGGDGMIDLFVVVQTAFNTNYTYVPIAPKVVVSPIQTTNVDAFGRPNKVTISFYGYRPNDAITTIQFKGPITITNTTNIPVASDGTASKTVNLTALTGGYGLPKGTYTVAGIATNTNVNLAKNGTLIIVPQVIIKPNAGHGRCDSSYCELANISIIGYGFDPNVNILKIDLWNINFTNVRYTFTNATTGYIITTGTYGNFSLFNLTRYATLKTNMTAGLYVPIVYENTTEGIINFTFRNVYYIVRPLLVLVAPTGIVKPGETVTIAAYGYGPGAKYYPGYNSLNVYWEKILKLKTVSLGNDGNATFQVTIPSDASFGVHYIWGVDAWEYEYSLAIIIGAKAYWTIASPAPYIPLTPPLSPQVSAGYNNETLVVCPCPQTVVGLSYCDKCVAYVGRCDYLGSKIRVFLSGLSPGETVEIYFGNFSTTPIKVVTANESTITVEFTVPTVPQGTYKLFAVGSVSGPINITSFHNGTGLIGDDKNPVYPQVVPKILLLDLNKDIVPILVGQGIVRVIGTGFPPGASVLAMLINNTDAGYSMNLQVQRWGSDNRGVLINTLSPNITPGIYVPVLEPGAYNISLLYVMPNATKPRSTEPSYVYVVNNVSRLVDKDYFNNAVNSLSNQISSVASAVSDVKTALNTVSSTLQQLSSAVSSGFDSISKKIDSAQSAITSASNSLSSKIDTVNSNVNAVSSKVDALSSKVDSVSSAVSDISSKVSTLDTAISKLQDAISGVNSAVQQLTGLSSKVDTISSAVSTLSSKVDTLTSAVNSVSSKVDNVASKVDNAANSLSSAINGVGSKVDTVSGKVDNVASKVDTVSGKVDAVSSKIDTVSSNLSGKIDSATSTLQTYIIITLVLALIAAATSIYAAIQLGRKLAA